ncbi:hypothetical protein BCV70DRAFT_70638 [Testicularia cyperi]|uniref:Uncharacterized protein n=1 Tax=Testicularia cyperi TaxID=1882483 RepID=A0A317XH92_9BASI|nr:hypothetical protein BCV70DRAFT_70638 [Testicularia cyperi]
MARIPDRFARPSHERRGPRLGLPADSQASTAGGWPLAWVTVASHCDGLSKPLVAQPGPMATLIAVLFERMPSVTRTDATHIVKLSRLLTRLGARHATKLYRSVRPPPLSVLAGSPPNQDHAVLWLAPALFRPSRPLSPIGSFPLHLASARGVYECVTALASDPSRISTLCSPILF